MRRNEPCLSNRSLESCIDERILLYKSFNRGSSRFTRLENCIFYGRNNQFRFYYHFSFFSPPNSITLPIYVIFNFLTSRQRRADSLHYFSTDHFDTDLISLTKYQHTAFPFSNPKDFRESGVKAVFTPPLPVTTALLYELLSSATCSNILWRGKVDAGYDASSWFQRN